FDHPVGPGVILVVEIEIAGRGSGRTVNENHDVVVGEAGVSRRHFLADEKAHARVRALDHVVLRSRFRLSRSRTWPPEKRAQKHDACDADRFGNEDHGSLPEVVRMWPCRSVFLASSSRSERQSRGTNARTCREATISPWTNF